MKITHFLAVLLGSVAILVAYLCNTRDNILEVYTPQDIIFINMDTNRITSETGAIDTTFLTTNQMIEYVGTVTASHSDI